VEQQRTVPRYRHTNAAGDLVDSALCQTPARGGVAETVLPRFEDRGTRTRGQGDDCLGRECWHRAVLDVSGYPADVRVQSFRPRVVASPPLSTPFARSAS
jgi:hypothetical protein